LAAGGRSHLPHQLLVLELVGFELGHVQLHQLGLRERRRLLDLPARDARAHAARLRFAEVVWLRVHRKRAADDAERPVDLD
jgi:hypothetical protein